MNQFAAKLDRLHGLQLRFMVTVIVGATLFSTLAGAFAWRQGHERAVASSHSALEGLALAVEKTTAIGAFAADGVLLGELVEGLARNALVAQVQVQSAHGKILASSTRAGRSADLANGMVIELRLASPFDSSETVGTLRIRADDARIDSVAAQEAFRQAVLMAAQAALLALLLYFAAAKLVSNPIIRLARELHGMQPGTNQRLAMPRMHRNDELGILIGGANALLDSNATALQSERELRAEIEMMEAQYRQIFDSSGAGIFVLDSAGRLINSNPTVSRVVGLSLEHMRHLKCEDFIARVFVRPAQVHAMIVQAKSRGETISGDLELVQTGDTQRWVHCLISVQGRGDDDGDQRIGGTVEGVIYDVTERKTREARVRHLSEHDGLTGLKNRAASDVTIDRMVDEALATGAPFSLLCIDLDGFKQINDTLGHQAGDQVLVACAQRMRAAVRRSSDLVARVGGDEFVVALRDIGPEDAVLGRTAQALLDGLRRPVVLADGTAVRVGASIGIACLPLHAHDRAALVRLADEALYEVKRNGRNSYAMALGECTPDLKAEQTIAA